MKNVMMAAALTAAVYYGIPASILAADDYRRGVNRAIALERQERSRLHFKAWDAMQEVERYKKLNKKLLEVECYKLPKYNNPRQPDSYVNDPGRYWYS